MVQFKILQFFSLLFDNKQYFAFGQSPMTSEEAFQYDIQTCFRSNKQSKSITHCLPSNATHTFLEILEFPGNYKISCNLSVGLMSSLNKLMKSILKLQFTHKRMSLVKKVLAWLLQKEVLPHPSVSSPRASTRRWSEPVDTVYLNFQKPFDQLLP